MNPSQWGPSLWRAIHFIALGFPDSPSRQDIDSYKAFFFSLGDVLPCYKCSQNYQRHLKEVPLDPFLVNSDSLFKWTVQLHNIVNRETGKAEMSLQDAYRLYEKGVTVDDKQIVVENKTGFQCKNYVAWFMIILNILTILLILFLLLEYRK